MINLVAAQAVYLEHLGMVCDLTHALERSVAQFTVIGPGAIVDLRDQCWLRRRLRYDTKNQHRVDIDAIPEMMVNKSRIVN